MTFTNSPDESATGGRVRRSGTGHETRWVFPTMGTVASIRVDGLRDESGVSGGLVDAIVGAFDRLEDEFSRWDPSSPATAIAEGRMRLSDSSDRHREVYARAIEWRNQTGGAFDPHRRDGTVDLAGIVKAVAIEEAGALLDTLDGTGWCCNVGGDVMTAGVTWAGTDWTVGIVDASDRHRLIRSVRLGPGRRAVATSGTSERGDHIWGERVRPRVVQCTVIAADIVTADVLATAVFVGGSDLADRLARDYGVAISATFADGDSRSWNLR